MAKAMLIMDMPSSCGECICYDAFPRLKCKKEKREVTREDILVKKPTWCPLRSVPDKKLYNWSDTTYAKGEKVGYNACIDEILGGGE